MDFLSNRGRIHSLRLHPHAEADKKATHGNFAASDAGLTMEGGDRSGDMPPLVSMMDKADHIAWAAEAVAVFQEHCRTGDEHAIADLICDLGHLAEERGLDFLSEVKRGIGHWYAEHHAGDGEVLGPDAAVEIVIKPK